MMKKRIYLYLYLSIFLLPLTLFSASIFDMLPENLSNVNNKSINTHSAIAGKNYLAFYFVSLNNPAANEFTSKLLKFYQTKAKEAKVEIILVSFDEDQATFQKNLKNSSIPWYVIPFNSQAKKTISSYYGIVKSPHLMVFNADGKLVTNQNHIKIYKRGDIFIEINNIHLQNKESNHHNFNQSLSLNENTNKKEAIKDNDRNNDADDKDQDNDDNRNNKLEENTPPAILKILPKNLLQGKRKTVKTSQALKNTKYIALYFSASWCGPCRMFTPQLVNFYKKTAKKSKIEVIFVSRDRNENEMKQYIDKANMPWYTIPFAALERNKLANDFKVNGIPRLIILDSNGKVVSNNARFDIVKYQEKAIEQWQSANYTPVTYQDLYKNSNNKNKSKKSYKTKKSRRRKTK